MTVEREEGRFEIFFMDRVDNGLDIGDQDGS